MRMIKLEMLLSVDQDLRMLSTRSMVEVKKKEENTQTNSTLVAVSSRAVRREKENGREKDYKKIKCC